MNFGVGGTGTADAMLFYEHFADKYKPDIVIDAMYLGNDVDDNGRYYRYADTLLGGKHNWHTVHQDGAGEQRSFVVIKEAKQDVQLSAPSLIISQTINNDSQYVAKLGEMLNNQVMIKNTGSASISGASILVKLSGRSFDISTLATSLGQVNIQDNSIVFDSQKNPALVLLAPNQDVSLNFSVKLKEGLSLSDTEVIKSKITLGDISQEFVNKVTAQ
jgi:hypothetical protein